MRTKHLFSAAMLTALFAACSNEEFVNPTAPTVANDGRPTVENVKLDFGKTIDGESNTRVAFDPSNGQYSWVDGDKVGALLMDELNATATTIRPYENPEEWAKLSWLEKYELSNYIHTDYPFIYNKTDNTWNSNAAMLEGNYFFAYPYEGYDSRRQLIHSIAGQTQKDGSLDATAEAFGRNQYWIGYSQIKEGNKTAEALTNVEMVRVLAPIRFQIKLIGTQEYKINKVTVQGTNVRTLLTIDPTCDFNLLDGSTSVGYTGENGTGVYNLKPSGSDNKYFNYANYLGDPNRGADFPAIPEMKEEVYDHTQPAIAGASNTNQVYNIDDESNYNRFNALRAIVDVESVKGDEVQYAEMVYETEQTLSKEKDMVYGVIFVNPDLAVPAGGLKMSIYTDRGIIQDINLTIVNTEIEKAQGKTTVITDKAISKLTPSTQNLITIQVDDNSINAADILTVNNDDDLRQLIGWNKSINRPYLAVLANDATLTKDMVETLRAAKKANVDNKFIVSTGVNINTSSESTGRKLIIAADAPADALNFVCLDGVEFDTDHNSVKEKIFGADVEILGEINLDSDEALGLPDGTGAIATATLATIPSKKITVAKDAKLNIVKANTTKLLSIENNGKINMGEGAKAVNVKIVSKEKAEMSISGDLQFAADSENEGIIEVGENGVLQGTTAANFTNKGAIKNEGKIWNIKNDGADAIVETSSLTNHFASNVNGATIKLTALNDPVTFASGVTNQAKILYVGENVHLNDANKALVTDLTVSGYLRVQDAVAGVTATVKNITVEEGKTITIEGGAYNSNTWIPVAKDLSVASSAVLNLSGTVTMNYLTATTKADVNVLKGDLYINNGIVAAINNLILGSKESFTEFGATVNVAKGATLTVAGDLKRNTDLSKVSSTINNNGTITATFTEAGVVVNGNEVTPAP